MVAWLPSIGREPVSAPTRVDLAAFLVDSAQKFMGWFCDRRAYDSEYHRLAIALTAVLIVHSAGAFSPDQALYRQFASSSLSDFALDFNLPVLLF